MDDQEIWDALHKHLRTIYERDAAAYRQTVSDDLVIYEWYVTPHRQDGVESHLFFISQTDMFPPGAKYFYQLLEPKAQRYGDTAILCYTLLMATSLNGVRKVSSTNESRVLVKLDGQWKVVHVHKSPTAGGGHVENMP
jgi:ketosteroid isomerase-like protein